MILNNNSIHNNNIIKLLTLGNSGVGKTSIITKYVDNKFYTNYLSTIGIDFKTKNIILQNKEFKIQIWDTAGQERFRTITNSYYKMSNGILLIYDITDRKSFEAIIYWIMQIDLHSNQNEVKILVGNKCDNNDRREVKFYEGYNFAEKYSIDFFEISAKENINVENLFITIISKIYNKRHIYKNNINLKNNNFFSNFKFLSKC